MDRLLKVNWIENNYLEGITSKGIKVPMDSIAVPAEPKGPTPKELVLNALAGCTMMDVLVIIKKSRKELLKFRMDVDAELAEQHPRKYTKIHLTYNFLSPDLEEGTAERAIKLSKESYCAVSAMLKATVEITTGFKIYRDEKEFIESEK
jgi:putative redox protein